MMTIRSTPAARWASAFAAISLFSIGAAYADDDHFEVKAAEAPRAIERAIQKLGARIPLVKASCLTADNPGQKDVCTYNVGDSAKIMLRATPVEHDVDDVTLICMPKSSAVIVECVAAYVVMMRVFTPNITEEKGREITGFISKGISVGDSAQVMVEDNRYIAQKVMGTLWMHIEPGTG